MKPFFVLFICFGLGCLTEYFVNGNINVNLSGRIALTVMLFFTAMGHFKFSKGMSMMLPAFIPAKLFVIAATGVLEILLAIAIHICSLQIITGWLLLAMFVLFLPANIYAAFHRIDYEKGTCDGKGLSYLWFRIPFQILLLAWTYYFVIDHQ